LARSKIYLARVLALVPSPWRVRARVHASLLGMKTRQPAPLCFLKCDIEAAAPCPAHTLLPPSLPPPLPPPLSPSLPPSLPPPSQHSAAAPTPPHKHINSCKIPKKNPKPSLGCRVQGSGFSVQGLGSGRTGRGKEQDCATSQSNYYWRAQANT
jgi:hypothetical protein